METCDRCGKIFDEDEAETEFVSEYFDLSYQNFRGTFCADCAIQILEDKEDGYYFETCEQCGCTFDLILEESKFDDRHSWFNGTSMRDFWKDLIRCADCAMEKEEEETSGEP